jgi:AP-3 complex subunit mu
LIPWRDASLKYTKNELFFDIDETVEVVVDGTTAAAVVRSSSRQSGSSPFHGHITGRVICHCKLSGSPKLVVNLNHSSRFAKGLGGIHPCVKMDRFSRDCTLAFTPPDGSFQVLEYM